LKATYLVLLFAITAIFATASDTRRAYLHSLPLRFEENRGRDTHPGVKFVARSPKFLLGLAPTESWLEWHGGSPDKTARVQTRLINANRATRLELEDRLEGTANYFLGNGPAWRTNVAGFRRARYREVYPGIDLIFHGEEGRLEYDFIVGPNVDPSCIRLDLQGQDSLRVDDDGDLVISTAAGDIRWKAPDIYQQIADRRLPVDGRFIIEKKRTVRFEIGDYDRNRRLIIDPALKYSTYLGGENNEAARGIGLDSAGNVYIAGVSSSPDLPTNSGVYQPNFAGRTALANSNFTGDGFVAKFSPAGKLIYLTYLGGAMDDGIAALAVDPAGNAYVTGETYSADFPSVNGYQPKLNSPSSTIEGDAFVTKLSPDGNKIIWSTFLGGTDEDIGTGITLDKVGNVFICGASRSTNFPTRNPIPGGDHFHGAGGEPIRHITDTVPEWEPGDAFVAELDPTGSKLLFATYIGGSADESALSIQIDSSSNVVVGGCTISADFPTTTGAYQRGFGGQDANNFFFHMGDGFVSKINPSNGNLIFSTYFGGSGDDCISGIALDSSNAIYMTGTTSSQNVPFTHGSQASFAGPTTLPNTIFHLFGDAFAAKLDPTGAKAQYFTYLGGSQNDGGTAIALDSQNNAYILGFTDSFNFPLAGNPLQSQLAGDGVISLYLFYGDAFLAVVSPDGTNLLYSTYLGGNFDERPFGIALDGKGNAYLAGNTVSTTFPTTPDALQKTFGGFKGHAAGTPRGDVFYTVISGFAGAAGGPVITKVANAEGGESTTISANTWTEIKGSGLSTPGVSSANCAPGYCWQAADFVNNQLPTSLQGVSVTMNGKPAYIYYISDTQINVLTPSDLASGPVQVVVTVNGIKSSSFSATAADVSITFFVLNGGPYVLATHLNNGLIGPTSLFPGVTTPAAPNETIVLYANGYGPIVPAVTPGSVTQAGSLPSMPPLQIGAQVANVTFAGLISPGLYQFNLVVPPNVPDGDNKIQSQYNGQTTPQGLLIPIQH
jgi:uncharacterized protein (TIGR03437 family)